MVQLAKNTQFTPDMPDGESFTFGYRIGQDGSPVIGEGIDEDPTISGISTPSMMKMLRYASNYVFHIDTTYKLDQSGYPVLVVGVSDMCRSFHPVAMFLTSQQTGEVISSALESLFDMYKLITGRYPSIRYCMGDADKAQYNAVIAVVSSKSSGTKNLIFLMCFFHVIKNVSDRVSKLPLGVVSLVFKQLYQMHYSQSTTEFEEQTQLAITAWKAVPTLHSFAEYFKKQWIDSQFSNWACYHTPTAFATINNPVEQFNNAITRDYALRTLLKLVVLAEQLTLMCRHRSRGTIVFSLECKPNRELQDRYKYLQKQGRLSVNQPHKHGLDFLLENSSDPRIAYVYQRGAPPRCPETDQVKDKKKLGKRNKHRMELLDQPVGGWRVNLGDARCQCRAWYKYGICAHVIAALRYTERSLPGEKPSRKRFANRRIKRKGRNASIGPALSLE